MKTILRSIVSLVVFALVSAYGQTSCVVNASLTSTGSSASFDNRFGLCSQWTVNLQNAGFTSAFLAFEGAADSSGSPGTFAVLTASQGANPIVLAAGQSANLNFFGPSNSNAQWLNITAIGVT